MAVIPFLTPQQQRFVSAILAGKSQSEAYKAAGYKGGKQADQRSLEKAASTIANGTAVAQALARARASAAERAGLTVDDLVAQLLHSRDVAFACDPPQVNASVSATMGIAKLLGLVVDRAQVDHIVHKPAFSSKVLELTEDEWKAQFAPARTAK